MGGKKSRLILAAVYEPLSAGKSWACPYATSAKGPVLPSWRTLAISTGGCWEQRK
jgi:hypothetical protein